MPDTPELLPGEETEETVICEEPEHGIEGKEESDLTEAILSEDSEV